AGSSAATGSRASSPSCARRTTRRRSRWSATSRRCRATTTASACRAAAAGASFSTATLRSTAAAASATSAARKRRRCPTSSSATRSRSPFLHSPCFFSSLNKETSPPRVVIESVRPQVDCGRYPVKRVVGERVVVEADVFTDGHDAVVAELLFKFHSEKDWQIVAMTSLGNDHWSASFPVEHLGRYQYTVRGWADPYLTWRRDLEKRKQAGQDLSVEMLIGKALEGQSNEARIKTYERVLEVVVDPVHARFSTW